MNKHSVGSITKGNVKLIEYEEGTYTYSDHYFIQSGNIGFWATKKELTDLFTVLNYYINMQDFNECEVVVDGHKLAIQ
jgi:hypothetical protein